MTAVHQVLASAGPYDAVSTQALVWRRLLGEAGYGGRDFVAHTDPRTPAEFAQLGRIDPADLVVLRYSAWSPALADLLETRARMLLVYHNITPAGYLWNHSATVAAQCAVGRLQLPAFARRADLAVADSEFNAAELREAGAERVEVVPIVFDRGRYDSPEQTSHADPLSVLSVGRVAPNKRHDLVLAAFEGLRSRHAPDATLTVIGEPITPAFGELIAGLAGPGVTFTGPVEQAAVNGAYASANALLHMSEHEGFCVPLLEAFHFGVPVVARRAGAMEEVGGDAVLWADDPAMAAELIAMLTEDSGLQEEMGRRGREQLEELSAERTRPKVIAAVEAALS